MTPTERLIGAARMTPIEAARLALHYARQTECDGCAVCDAARAILKEATDAAPTS